MPESGANATGLDHLSGYILLQLMNGHCIAAHEHVTTPASLPAPKAFVDALYKEFSKNGTIPFAKFKSLLGILGIGNSGVTTTTTTGHEGHNHRKRRSAEEEEEEEDHHIMKRSVTSPSISGKVSAEFIRH